MTNIKIFVTHKEKHKSFETNIIKPIQTGRSIANEVFEDMIGDNTGDNISQLNPYFCETSAIYWVWKNYNKIGNPDYIGFMHYRRHLSFIDSSFFNECLYGLVHNKILDEEYLIKYGLTDEKISEVVSKYDIVVSNRYDVRKLNFSNVYEHYKSSSNRLHIEDYNKALEIIKKKYPSFIPDLEYYNSNPYGYFTNIFVMKKNIFFDFCKWYFDILFELYNYVKEKKYTIQEIRLYASEWLLGIYLTHLSKNKKIKIKELQRTFIDEPDFTETVIPIYKEKKAICLSCDQNYVSKLSVTIQSIICNAAKNNKYDIVVLISDLQDCTKKKLLSMATNNVSIRLFNINSYLSNYNNIIFREIAHFSKAIYYRLFLPKIFKNYNQVCYLDCDLIVQTDINLLLNQNLENKCIGACLDTEFSRLLYTDPFWQNYCCEQLNFSIYDSYFNSGVILFDINKCIEQELTSKCLNLLSSNNNLLWPDQDVLNIVLKNNVKYLDGKWNFEWHLPYYDPNFSEHLYYDIYKKYKLSSMNPYIIHYAGGIKPWNHPELDYAYIWWKYARLSPFYEEIIQKDLFIPHQNYTDEINKLRSEFSNIHFPNMNAHFSNIDSRINKIEKKIYKKRGIIKRIIKSIRKKIK